LGVRLSSDNYQLDTKTRFLFTGKSQETSQLAVGRNGKRGFGSGSPYYGFFLGISPGHIARTSSRNKMKNFRFEAPGLAPRRFTRYNPKRKGG